MTSTDFLKRLCEGYVRCYRTLNLRGNPRNVRDLNRLTDSRGADATHRELNYFGQLGEMLGFVARRELARRDRTRWDLSWVDIESEELFLCMESETFDDRADKAMDKLLRTEPSKSPCYLVGVLWLKEDHFAKVKRAISERLKGRSLLLIAWVGPDIYHATDLKVIVASKGKVYIRQGMAEQDNDKYWYAYFIDKGWRSAPGYLRGRTRPPQTNDAK
jgi:hypothetical protein